MTAVPHHADDSDAVCWCEVDPTEDLPEFSGVVIADVIAEMHRQVAKFGEPDHPSFPVGHWVLNYVPTAARARDYVEQAFAQGHGTWFDIALEEIAEACEESDNTDELAAELIQCAAVFASWAASVRRRQAVVE